MSEGDPLRLNKYMLRKHFKGSLDIYNIQIEIMLNIMMSYYTCVKWKKHGTLTWVNNLIHNGLMYWTKV